MKAEIRARFCNSPPTSIWGRAHVGRRRCTPSDGPLAHITRADTHPLPCRPGYAPEGKLDPCPCHPLLPVHRTHRRRPLQAAGEAPCAEHDGMVSRPTDHQGYRGLAPSWRWRVRVVRHSTQHRKSGSPAGARGRILESRARCHFSAVAQCCSLRTR
jgi:hypothetical protein